MKLPCKAAGLGLLALALALSGCGTSSLKAEETPAAADTTQTQADAAWLDQALDAFLNDGDTLPAVSGSGAAVVWSVKSGNAEITDNVIHKTAAAAEYEPVQLHAVIGSGAAAVEADYGNLLLLDPYAGWLLSYFSEDGTDKEEPKLGYTYDGIYWYKLNNDSAVFKARTGTKKVRDPYIVRKKDGTFAMLATQGYDTDSIYCWDSADAITYDNERLLQVNVSSQDLQMSGKQAWAPEAFYDRTKDAYVIYWSSPDDGGMYYNTSSNLTAFSTPQKLLDAGFDVIDGTIVKEGYHYSIILKDERQPMEEYSQLFLGTSDTDYLHFDHFSSPITTRHQCEGPFVIQRQEDTLVYYDDYTRHQFLALYSLGVYDQGFVDLDMSDVLLPFVDPAHASVIPVTWKELDRIMKAYGG